jgi:hypothetical protein
MYSIAAARKKSVIAVIIKGPDSHAYGRIKVRFRPPSPGRDSGPGRSKMSPPPVALGGEAIGIIREILQIICMSMKSTTTADVRSIADANISVSVIALIFLMFLFSKAPVFNKVPVKISVVPV